MNTPTFQETNANVTGSATAAMAASPELLLIPLPRLRPSSRNVHESGGASGGVSMESLPLGRAFLHGCDARGTSAARVGTRGAKSAAT